MIYVGAPYYPGATAVAESAGGSYSTGDERAQWNAALKDATGSGILGRRLEPVFFPYDQTSGGDQNYQNACATWTQDQKVLAILDHPVGSRVPA